MEKDDDLQVSETVRNVQPKNARFVYLITYSQADLSLVPERESFVLLVVHAFRNADPLSACNILNWVCSMEHHSDGGVHYHMAVKLESRRRWLKFRNFLDSNHGIKVNFSGVHVNYYSAWLYATKDDKEYIQSPNHPDLTNSDFPVTTNAGLCVQSNAVDNENEQTPDSESADGRKRKRKRMSIFDVSQLAVSKKIRTRLELLAFANEQKREGKTDLAQFIANRGSKAVEEALTVGWELEEAEKKLERSKLTRIEVLAKKLEDECVDGCLGKWLVMAIDILTRNGIDVTAFAEAVRVLLEKGRGKYRNIYLKGPVNCGKTFLLNPLNQIYNTFSNPATTTFAWVGAEAADVIFLNDFRWSKQIIPWHDLLLMLESQVVRLPAPKSHYSKDATLSSDVPLFCTAKEEISFVQGGVLDARETEMMKVRWNVFSFHREITKDEQVETAPRRILKPNSNYIS